MWPLCSPFSRPRHVTKKQELVSINSLLKSADQPRRWRPNPHPQPCFLQPLCNSRLPWWLSSKESACQCRRRGFERSPGGGNGNPLQSSYLGNPTDRGAWLATVHRIAKESDTTEQLDSNRQPPPPQRCVSSGSVLRGYGD